MNNKHVNDLLLYKKFSPLTTKVPGWNIDCESGDWCVLTAKRCWDYKCQNWYCYTDISYKNGAPVVSTIKTKLYGSGKAKLDFGNCYNLGDVRFYLNNREIAAAPGGTNSTVVEFDYTDGNELKLVEHFAIIMFNSFQILRCTSKGKPENQMG